MPWDLTPEQRRSLNRTSRRLVQAPGPGEKIDGEKRMGGHKVSDLLLLAAMDDLAMQGNEVARHVASRLRERMNIDRGLRSLPHGRPDA